MSWNWKIKGVFIFLCQWYITQYVYKASILFSSAYELNSDLYVMSLWIKSRKSFVYTDT